MDQVEQHLITFLPSFKRQWHQKSCDPRKKKKRKFTQMTKSINYHWFCRLKFDFLFLQSFNGSAFNRFVWSTQKKNQNQCTVVRDDFYNLFLFLISEKSFDITNEYQFNLADDNLSFFYELRPGKRAEEYIVRDQLKCCKWIFGGIKIYVRRDYVIKIQQGAQRVIWSDKQIVF